MSNAAFVIEAGQSDYLGKPGKRPRPVADRFWEKVRRGDPEECWPWTRSTDKKGRGAFHMAGRTVIASRVAYALAHPNDSLTSADQVCHTCDNPPCCNPSHLYKGDHQTNTADRMERSRQSRGEEHGDALRGRVPSGDEHWTRRMPERMNLVGLRRGSQ